MALDKDSSTHPQLPPTTEDDQLSWLRLLRSRRVGATTFHRLMAEHGDADAALAALPDLAQAAGVKGYSVCEIDYARAELAAGRRAGATLVAAGEDGYPPDLAGLRDAPPLMWAKGNLSLAARPIVALVGARNASSLGTRMARKLAIDLGKAGFVVASGLARGVDRAAHEGALDSGTIGVLGSGIDRLYPPQNADIGTEMGKRGLLLSEFRPGTDAQPRHFPARNRIISGMARAVVVVEAAARSGSLITARGALDQGREVLVVPGHPFDARASGCNMLIRDGATLVRGADDVIEAIGPATHKEQASLADTPEAATAPEKPRSLQETAALHQQILDRLGPSPMAEDQLIRDLGARAKTVTPVLIDLEMDGQISRAPGGLIARR